MANKSAGILVYRWRLDSLEVLLVHPGGPFWKNKNHHSWSIPKGLVDESEDLLDGAIREFNEETGFSIGKTNLIELEEVKQPGGKVVKVWAKEGDFDPADLKSNTFKMEWPPKSGTAQHFPEVDKAAWFGVENAKTKVVKGQISIIDQLVFQLEEMQS